MTDLPTVLPPFQGFKPLSWRLTFLYLLLLITGTVARTVLYVVSVLDFICSCELLRCNMQHVLDRPMWLPELKTTRESCNEITRGCFCTFII